LLKIQNKGENAMLFLITASLVVLLAGLCFARGRAIKIDKPDNEYPLGGTFLLAIAIIIIIVGVATSGNGWYEQISDFEDVKKFQKVEAIYHTKATALTKEFANHLAVTYPKHEKDIYSKISPDKVSMYFAKYPELQTSKTLVVLVEHINKLQSDVYNQQINIEQALKNTRLRLRNPWLFTFMIPTE